MKGTLTAAIYSAPNDDPKNIIASVTTGDQVTIVERQKSWTKIQMSDGKEGWIKVGYLKPTPPADIQLTELQAELETARTELDRLKQQSSELHTTQKELNQQSEEQQTELETLRRANVELEARIRAGERWPEMITGASLLAAGMFLQLILGAFVSWRAARRPTSRVRF